MSKRQEIRARRQRQRLINRLLIIGMVVIGVGLIAAAIILPRLPTPVIDIVAAAPRNFTAPVDKTSIGDPAAPVRVDVWEDFQCPACQYYSQTHEPLIIQNYVEKGKVFYTFHFFTSISAYAPGNTESEHTANAAMCAADQGKFWEYHDVVFANWKGENIGGYADNRLIAFAQFIGLHMTDFKTCFKDNVHADFVAEDYQAGRDLGVQGTPAIYVDGVLVVSPRGEQYIATYEEIVVYIEDALAGK
jgi:protein-disulfide isomerase